MVIIKLLLQVFVTNVIIHVRDVLDNLHHVQYAIAVHLEH